MHEITVSHGLVFSLFLAGLIGGATHCVAMCGPFVISQTGHLTKFSQAAILPYHLGRITTYTILAVLLASILNLAFLFLPIRSLIIAPILVIAGVIFLVSAFPALAKLFPWAGQIQIRFMISGISKGMSYFSGQTNVLKQYFMGILLGFMPCGLVVSALMAAATATTPSQAALAMAAFGAGTMPALIVTAYGGQTLKLKYPYMMQRVTQGMMVWSAVWLFTLAGFLLI